MMSRLSAVSATVSVLLCACLSTALSIRASTLAATSAHAPPRVVILEPVTVVALRMPATPR